MIQSIYVPKETTEDSPCLGLYVQNEVRLSDENCAAMKDVVMGELVQVEMRVTGIKEEEVEGGNGKIERMVTMAIETNGDKSGVQTPVGEEARRMYP